LKSIFGIIWAPELPLWVGEEGDKQDPEKPQVGNSTSTFISDIFKIIGIKIHSSYLFIGSEFCLSLLLYNVCLIFLVCCKEVSLARFLEFDICYLSRFVD